ncbi:hypothetical protein C0J52_19657 [Blattella germanica]|nr:hypothetical protein C0J52_19657 [Blattella germanica]
MIHTAGDYAVHTCTSRIRVDPEQLALPLSVGIAQVSVGQFLNGMKLLGGSRPPAVN